MLLQLSYFIFAVLWGRCCHYSHLQKTLGSTVRYSMEVHLWHIFLFLLLSRLNNLTGLHLTMFSMSFLPSFFPLPSHLLLSASCSPSPLHCLLSSFCHLLPTTQINILSDVLCLFLCLSLSVSPSVSPFPCIPKKGYVSKSDVSSLSEQRTKFYPRFSCISIIYSGPKQGLLSSIWKGIIFNDHSFFYLKSLTVCSSLFIEVW